MRLYLIDQLKSKRRLTFDLFLRLMGFVYFCAFFSVISQVDGLYGDHGILPVRDFLEAVKVSNGDLSFLACPTLLWLAPSAQALMAIAIAGTMVAVFLMAGILPSICTASLYLLFLSIVSVGQEFLSYQWDFLLLQSGFLAIIVALLQNSPNSKRLMPLATFFFFWLNFHLIFSSGICKIASGDPTWADLTALTYHFSTQPLPTPLAIFANAMPLPISKYVCFCTLAIEIFVPFLVFAPRAIRLFAVLFLAFLQVMIALTGNYCFFNLLTIVLLLPLTDDTILRRIARLWSLVFAPGRKALVKRAFREPLEMGAAKRPGKTAALSRILAIPMIAIVSLNCLLNIGGRAANQICPGPLLLLHAVCQPFGIDNHYGLFAVMTRERPEILIEGSDDGITYKTYQFKYKVSRIDQAPPIVAPLQPRLDWQMWFEGLNATFGDPYDPDRGLNPALSSWFVRFLARLSEGDKAVLSLMADNPFPHQPPKFIRARVVNYYLTSPSELMQTGHWWRTKDIGIYFDSKLLQP